MKTKWMLKRFLKRRRWRREVVKTYAASQQAIIAQQMSTTKRVTETKEKRAMTLEKKIMEMERQISCAARGHRISIKCVWGDLVDRVDDACFECVDCEVRYTKPITRLTPKERALYDAFNLKEHPNAQT